VSSSKIRSIADAVHSDIAASRAIYEWVGRVCLELGARQSDLVPFEKYAGAARSLTSPSSAARALAAGAAEIERVDRLVQLVGRQVGLRSGLVDAVVERVDNWLARNRASSCNERYGVAAANPISIA
jgi:hypothetical protein